MLCYVMLCYVMLCYVMLCYVMLRYVILCYMLCIKKVFTTEKHTTIGTDLYNNKLRPMWRTAGWIISGDTTVQPNTHLQDSNTSHTMVPMKGHGHTYIRSI